MQEIVHKTLKLGINLYAAATKCRLHWAKILSVRWESLRKKVGKCHSTEVYPHDKQMV